MNEKITQIDSMHIAGLEHTGPYKQIGAAFGKLGGICAEAQLFTPNSRMLAVYYDVPDEVPAEKLRSLAAITVEAETKVPDSLIRTSIEGGEYAVGTHKGPYENIDGTYAHIEKWIQEQGRVPRDAPCFEIYLNDPGETAPNDLLTDIYVPI